MERRHVMRITTNWKDAVDDPGNRATAARLLEKDHPEIWNEADETLRGDWVTDLISDWVAEARHDLESFGQVL